MSWIAFTLLGGGIWTVVNIIDKHIIGHEFRDPILAIVTKSYVIFTVFLGATLISGSPIMLGWDAVIPSFLAGAFSSLGIFCYYTSLRKGEVSKVVPIFSTAPLFTLALGAVFLGERFTSLTYLGIALIVIGAITISAKRVRHHLSLDKVAAYAIGVAAITSVRSILVKVATEGGTIWPVLFWIGLGSALTITPVLIIHFSHIKVRSKKRFRLGLEHLIVLDFFDALGFLCLMIAVGLGPVSLVTAILHTKPLMVFVLATILGIFFPKYLKEKFTPRILAQKIVGTLLIVGGALLVI